MQLGMIGLGRMGAAVTELASAGAMRYQFGGHHEKASHDVSA